MEKNLVIVESPSKAKTIKKYLGNKYIVKSSVGHIIDLPKSKLGIDLKNNFEPNYIIVRGKANILKEIKDAYKKINNIFLATDPDREGEAIAWHLHNYLNIPKNIECRVIFNEITLHSIKNAIKNPIKINKNLVDAQQSRRILDRIVGYKLSPLLWQKIKKGLSAGRVQSAALQIIIDKEKEINFFKEKEYWSINVILETNNIKFVSELIKINDKSIEIKNIKEAENIIKDIKLKNKIIITKISKNEKNKKAAAPFITSTLQQKASKSINFSSKKTMIIAQQLYEGINLGKKLGGLSGLITYMRTDSTRISNIAKEEVKKYILNTYGKEYLPKQNNYYKLNKNAQDAHEAIRPTSILNTPEKIKNILTIDQFKLYKLIWNRFLASEMTDAIYEQVILKFKIDKYLFKSIGSIMKFEGFLKIMKELKNEDKILPKIDLNTELKIKDINKIQHFTKAPSRYTEASLIKKLEELNIGRPSTYANILDTIQRRNYIIKENKQFYTTELGNVVGKLLYDYFKDIINITFTSKMEKELDLIAEGKLKWKDIVKNFYDIFSVLLEKADKDIKKIKITINSNEKTDILCDKCGKNMIIKNGRFGKFLACSGFPECKYTKSLLKKIGIKCPNCEGEIIVKKSKKGKIFYGCNNYPNCNILFWYKPTDKKCLNCGALLLEKTKEYICSNKDCLYKLKKENNEIL